MHLIQRHEIEEALDAAVKGKVCTEAWLGIGHRLFLGFGDKLLLPAVIEDLDPRPPYMLQTGFAEWWVEDSSGVLGTSQDDRSNAEAVVYRLIGLHGVGWRFPDSSQALEVEFEGGYRVRTSRMTDGDVSCQAAWELKMPDDYYRIVRWDGVMYARHADERGPADLTDCD